MIVADELDFLPMRSVRIFQPSQSSSAMPSSMLDDRVSAGKLGEIMRLLFRRARLPAFSFVNIGTLVEELARGGIKRQRDLLARLETGALDRLEAEIERRLRRRQIGREAAFIADIGVEPGLLQSAL